MFKPLFYGKNINININKGAIMKLRITKCILLLFLTFSFSCSLTSAQVTTDKFNSIKIISVNYSKDKINIIYPKIIGLKDKKVESKVNSALKNKALSFIDTSNSNTAYSADYTVKYNKYNILSIVFSQDIYHQGAAHNYYQYNSITLNLTTGDTYKLKDIYVNDNNYKRIIEENIDEQSRERVAQGKLYLFSDESIEVNDEQFYINDQYVVVYYNPYEIASFSEGIIEFNINKNLTPANTAAKISRIIDRSALPKIFSLTQSDVHRLYGVPDDTGTFEGAYYENYYKDNITFFLELTTNENPRVISLGLTEDYTILDTQAGMSVDQVKNILGKPAWEGKSFEDDTYYIQYYISGHDIIYALDDTNTNIEFIQVKPSN